MQLDAWLKPILAKEIPVKTVERVIAESALRLLHHSIFVSVPTFAVRFTDRGRRIFADFLNTDLADNYPLDWKLHIQFFYWLQKNGIEMDEKTTVEFLAASANRWMMFDTSLTPGIIFSHPLLEEKCVRAYKSKSLGSLRKFSLVDSGGNTDNGESVCYRFIQDSQGTLSPWYPV